MRVGHCWPYRLTSYNGLQRALLLMLAVFCASYRLVAAPLEGSLFLYHFC